LFDQWQAHGPKYFVGEEYDDEGCERKDKDAEEARSTAIVWELLRGNEGENPKDDKREEVSSQSNSVRPTELHIRNRDGLD